MFLLFTILSSLTVGFCAQNVVVEGQTQIVAEVVEEKDLAGINTQGNNPTPFADADQPVTIQKSLVPLKIVSVRKTRFPRWLDLLTGRTRPQHETLKPIHTYVERKVMYPIEKVVPVPLKEYVEVPKPYAVPVVMKRKVPVILEKKVPVKVEVPVERPYPVEVAVPYEVTVLKKVPFVVEKKVPYHVKVPEYVQVPVPIYYKEKEVK